MDSNRFKLIFLALGDVGVGKTSIISRYTNNTFSYDTQQTLKVDCERKTCNLKDGKGVFL